MSKKIERKTPQKGDIIQITNVRHPWFMCLLVVEASSIDTIMASAIVPTNTGVVYQPIKLENDMKFKVVGKAVIVTESF